MEISRLFRSRLKHLTVTVLDVAPLDAQAPELMHKPWQEVGPEFCTNFWIFLLTEIIFFRTFSIFIFFSASAFLSQQREFATLRLQR